MSVSVSRYEIPALEANQHVLRYLQDAHRPPPTFREAMATVGAMMSHADEERLAEILMAAPEPWLRAWVNEALENCQR